MIKSFDNCNSFQSENILFKPWVCMLCFDVCVLIWQCCSVETKRSVESCAAFSKNFFSQFLDHLVFLCFIPSHRTHFLKYVFFIY